MTKKKIKKFDWLRFISTALLLCAVTFGLFYIHSGKVAEIIASLTAEEKYPNSIWLIEFVSTALPVLVAVILMNILYCDKNSYVPVYTQREKLWASVILAAFIFGALLAYVFYQSRGGEVTDSETGEVIKTLWDRTYMWFFAQVLPMIILISYHSMRISTEKRELLEAEESARASEDPDTSEESAEPSESTETEETKAEDAQ